MPLLQWVVPVSIKPAVSGRPVVQCDVSRSAPAAKCSEPASKRSTSRQQVHCWPAGRQARAPSRLIGGVAEQCCGVVRNWHKTCGWRVCHFISCIVGKQHKEGHVSRSAALIPAKLLHKPEVCLRM